VVDAGDCKKNVIEFGPKEEGNEDMNNLIDGAFKSVGQKPRQESTRIGSVKVEEPNKLRPMKVSLSSSAHLTKF
jgi:hypothetical protein